MDEMRREQLRRQAVFAQPRKTVLLKILAMGPIPGFAQKERNDTAIEVRHKAEAEARGLNPYAYRNKTDTGFGFAKEPGVRVNGLIEQLESLGLRCTAAFLQLVREKGLVNTLVFSAKGEQIPIPQAAREILSRRFNHCTVWCNLRSEGRLDTINLAKGRITNEPAKTLVIEGNTYRYLI